MVHEPSFRNSLSEKEQLTETEGNSMFSGPETVDKYFIIYQKSKKRKKKRTSYENA